ncbi:hypothetical protein [Parasphingorhabdus sp.]|uniref:hypothetical protein n=1 Tax=Parasphingorhabdus sp. TaxID=2709688 RepID=UPI003BAF1BBD
MTEDKKPQSGDQQNWPGLSEVDKALAENRLTAYTWKKTWADPWGRLKLVTIFIGLIGFAIFVAIYDGLIKI